MKRYHILLAGLLTVLISNVSAQKSRTIRPEIGTPVRFSVQEEQTWQRVLEICYKLDSGLLKYDKLPAEDKKYVDSIESGYGPVTVSAGCSWYCGGEMYRVSSASPAEKQDGAVFKAENIHDFSLFTPWIPEAKNGKINFYFKPNSARVGEIIIYNGYTRNEELFGDYGRAKQIRLYINNVYHATLLLSDTAAPQTFRIKPVQSTNEQKDLVLSLEVTDMYKGRKYGNAAISEINFGGPYSH